MKKFAFKRNSRLKSKRAIDRLFGKSPCKEPKPHVHSCLSYPLRVLWVDANERTDGYQGAKVLISVPKKKLRKATNRVTTRRRIREAWRLSNGAHQCGEKDIALIYISEKIEDYKHIQNAIKRIITKISPPQPTGDAPTP